MQKKEGFSRGMWLLTVLEVYTCFSVVCVLLIIRSAQYTMDKTILNYKKEKCELSIIIKSFKYRLGDFMSKFINLKSCYITR